MVRTIGAASLRPRPPRLPLLLPRLYVHDVAQLTLAEGLTPVDGLEVQQRFLDVRREPEQVEHLGDARLREAEAPRQFGPVRDTPLIERALKVDRPSAPSRNCGP